MLDNALGAPDIKPVDGLKYRPAKISGEIEYDKGAVPPDAITGANVVTP
jgi:hypothetical protein